MPKNNKKQLAFDPDIYIQPDATSAGVDNAMARPAKSAKVAKTRTTVSPSLQPFLPGLSRRGRPRSKNPMSSSVRASESRKRRLAEGMKRIELVLEPEVVSSLDALAAHFKVSRLDLITRLLKQAAKRILPKKTDGS